MNAKQAAEVLRIATELGISPEVFDGWQGHVFALYQDRVGRSSTLAAAVAEAERRAARGDWTLDIGLRAIGLPREQGTAFHARLQAAEIPIGTWSQATKYINRIDSITTENADVLRELGEAVTLRYENVTWVPVGEVEAIHAEQMEGAEPYLAAIRDGNLLISAVAMPATTFGGGPLYRSLAEMAATYAWGIARNHPFVDGNKRTALLTALLFLRLNGFAPRVGPEWVEIMVSVADSTTGYSRLDLVSAFRDLMGTDVAVSP